MDLDELIRLAKEHGLQDTGTAPLLTCAFVTVSIEGAKPVVMVLDGFDELPIEGKRRVCHGITSALGVRAVALVSEVWGVRKAPPAGRQPHECPDREEFRVVFAVDLTRQESFIARVVRAADNTPRFGEWEKIHTGHDGDAILQGLSTGVQAAAVKRSGDPSSSIH